MTNMPEKIINEYAALFCDHTPYYSQAEYVKLSPGEIKKSFKSFMPLYDSLSASFALWVSEDEETFVISLCNEPIAFISDFSYVSGYCETVHEIDVFVCPDYRHHRLGSRLCLAMLDMIDHKSTVYLLGHCDGFAQYLGAEFSHSELYMARPSIREAGLEKAAGTVSEAVAETLSDVTDEAFPADIYFETKEKKDGSLLLRMFVKGKSVAKLNINVYSGSICISHVYTNNPMRGKGYAGLLIMKAASMFPDCKITLQVSGQNKPALMCYTKAGFKTIQRIDYFIVEY